MNINHYSEEKMSLTPQVLQVDMAGMPHSWLSIKEAIEYYAKGEVVFELGSIVATYRGGFNRINNQQSVLTANSIIGVKGNFVKKQNLMKAPALTNDRLFERDRYMCAFCGDIFKKFTDQILTRDHITPSCQNGKDTWNNVVTACKPCNGRKGGRTPEQANMQLLYLPYTPDHFEGFILGNERRILADQMEFLLQRVNKNSRFKKLS